MPLLIMFLILPFCLAGNPPSASAHPAKRWNAVFQAQDGWTGGDCAGTVPLPGDRVLWLFGDSWIGPVREGRHAEGSHMVNNAIAVHPIGSKGAPPKRGTVDFVWGSEGDDGKPRAWVVPDDSARGEHHIDKNLRYWPTGGGVVAERPGGGHRLYVFLMRIRDRDGADGVWNFEGCGSAVVRVENPEDRPIAWRKAQTTLTRLPAQIAAGVRRVSWGVAAMVDDTGDAEEQHVLIYGVDTTDGLNKKLLLARVPADHVDRFRDWRFWDGRGWSRRPDNASPIADNVMDELTVHRFGAVEKPLYLMIYSKPILDDHIVARTAPTPQGPWSAIREIYRCPEPATDKRLMAYSAKAHPELSRDGQLLITYCVNSTDFFHMAGDATIYRPRFIEMPRRGLRDGSGR